MTKRGKGKAGFAHLQDLVAKFKFMYEKMLLVKKHTNFIPVLTLVTLSVLRYGFQNKCW